MRLIWAVVTVCVLSAGAQTHAQRKPAAPKPKPTAAAETAWPIESIAIEGLHNYTREQVLGVVGLKPGQKAAAKDFEAARQRLLATGVFESAGMRYGPGAGGQGYAVTFEVAEAGPTFPVRFEDLGAPPEKLREALKQADPFFGPQIPATETLLARWARTLEAALGGGQKVAGRLEPDENQQLSVVFRPAAAPLAVARVRFTGNQVVPSSALENAINAVAVGVPYREPRFRLLLESQIRPFYEARGRVRVAFPQIRTEPEKDVKGVAVTVTVEEGASYSLGAVDVAGAGLTPEELKKITEFKSGEVFNRETLQAGVVKLEKRLRRNGYMRVASEVERRINDQTKTVDVTLRFQPGPRYVFGQLAIEGLDILSEPVVRQMWGLKPGDSFDGDYPDHFLDRVREEEIFDNLGQTRAAVNLNDSNHTADVTLVFHGESPKPKKPVESNR
ncbi:MAG: POTRA domain-containing protein [Bryobacteraceae bacterium]|jgi:outer membrane protein insertion porin family